MIARHVSLKGSSATVPKMGSSVAHLLLWLMCLAAAAVATPVPTAESAGMDVPSTPVSLSANPGANSLILSPCRSSTSDGTSVEEYDSCNNTNLCDQYSVLIGMLQDEINELRNLPKAAGNESPLEESQCNSMPMNNGSLRMLNSSELTCTNRAESDILAHEIIVIHQAFAYLLMQPDHSSQTFPSFQLIHQRLQAISCGMTCHCRSLNSSEVQNLANRIVLNIPTQMTHKWQLGCVALKYLYRSLEVIKTYLAECN